MTSATAFETAAMKRAIARAREACDEAGKSGIAAAVLKGDRIVSLEANQVFLDHDPTHYAEIVALGAAGQALGQADLSGCTLISTLQPCEMCLAAARFAGIDRIIFAAQKPDVAARYFAFPHLDMADFCGAGGDFVAIGGVMQDAVLDLYADGDE